MGYFDSFLGIMGFGIGIQIGLLVGFLFFIHFQPADAHKESDKRACEKLDSTRIVDIIHELPLWVMSPDYERVDWLNRFVEYMWPFFDKAASNIIRASAESAFAEFVGKYKIWSICIKRFTLGSFPPKVHGLKAQESKENELVIDLAFRWAGNSDIIVAIDMLCLKLEVQIVDIQMSAAMRVVLKPLVPTFPCFSCVEASLMEKPKIDFGLKLLGADIMAIPGLYHVVQEIIQGQMVKLYHWPQSLEVQILDYSIGATKKPVGILHVKIVRARNLLNMDLLSTSDPYVKVSLTGLNGDRLPAKKTTVKMNNLNPEWNEDFKLIVKDPESQVLQLQLFDWEKVGAHDYLGMQVTPLSSLTPYVKKELTLDLVHSMDPNDRHNKKPRGHITVETTFVPFMEDSKNFSVKSLNSSGNDISPERRETLSFAQSGLLQVTVVEAENLEGKWNHINPYVVVLFQGERKKTKTIKRCRKPHWNEEFEFVQDEAPVKDGMHIQVMSRKRRFGFMTKECLGYVDINMADVVYNGHINEKFDLIGSSSGIIRLDLRWKIT